MRITYDKKIDSVYIHLNDKPGSDVIIINDYINIDIDEKGQPVGIEIYQKAEKFVNLKNINFENISDSPVKDQAASGF